MTCVYSKTFMRSIDKNQFQPINTSNEFRALQGNNIPRKEAIPNGEAQTKQPLSTFTDDEKEVASDKSR